MIITITLLITIISSIDKTFSALAAAGGIAIGFYYTYNWDTYSVPGICIISNNPHLYMRWHYFIQKDK